MQIHEITLKEAAPRVPVKTGLAQRSMARNAPVQTQQPQPQQQPQQQPQLTTAQQLAQADAAEMQSRRARASAIPGAGPMTQALGNYIANKIGPRGLPSQKAGTQVPQQQIATPAQPVAKSAQPTTAQAVAKPTQTAPVQGGSELQKAQAAGSPARLAVGDNRSELQIAAEPNSIAQRQLAQEPNKAAIPGEPLQQPASTAPAQATPAQTYPPITIGAGPKATVYVNKGKGYTDSKTGKPIPPTILKAMGPQ